LDAAGAFERYLRKATKTYHLLRDYMAPLLTDYQQQGDVKAFTVPDGYITMWGEFNKSALFLTEKSSK